MKDMIISRERKVEEAVKRMKKLHIIPDAIRQFKSSGTVMVSEPPLGALFWVDDEQKQLIKQFEEEHNALVYTVVRCYSVFGKMDSFLYVSDYEEEWKDDVADIERGYAMSYTYNYDAEWCSEFGSIAIEARFGGLVRTA